MVIYIYLAVQDIALRCVYQLGCTSISVSHFTALMTAGLVELIFEMPLVVRIFKGKNEER